MLKKLMLNKYHMTFISSETKCKMVPQSIRLKLSFLATIQIAFIILIPVLCKTTETFISEQIQKYFFNNQCNIPFQQAHRPAYS